MAVAADRGVRAQEGGKKYDVLPVDEQQKPFALRLPEMFSTGAVKAGDDDALTDYFSLYYFPDWTQAKNAGQLPEKRHKFCLALRKAAGGAAPQFHDRLNSVALEFMNKLAQGNFAPVVRVNAMLLIGDLNATEAVRTGVQPQPLPEALPVLLKNIDNPKQIDAVKAAALVGVARHVTMSGGDAAVAAAMLKVLKMPIPPGQIGDGYAAVQAGAAGVLGQLGVPGDGGANAAALAVLAANAKAPLAARCAAARALGYLNYGSGVKTGDLTAALAHLALDALDDEKPLLLRRLQWRLRCVTIGLTGAGAQRTGVLGATDPGHRQPGDALQKTLDKLLKIDAGADVEVQAQSVKAGQVELNNIVEKTSK